MKGTTMPLEQVWEKYDNGELNELLVKDMEQWAHAEKEKLTALDEPGRLRTQRRFSAKVSVNHQVY